MMHEYIKIDKIKNVWEVNPVTGDYSYDEDGRHYLCIDGVFLEKEDRATDLVSVGEYVYARYGCGTLEIYSGHTVLKVFEKDYGLLDRDLDTYIEYQGYDPETFELHENIIFVSDGRRLLAQDVPYSLYEVEGMVFGYELFKTEFCRIDISSEVLWCFPLRRIDDEGCDRGADHLDKVLGIANGMIWICTDWGRLIALNVETGELMYQFIPADVAEDKIVFMDEENSVYRLIGGVGVFFFRETDKTLLSISNWGILILDAATAELIESYSFAKVDPQGIATFEHVMNPRLQGDYFVFMGERTHEFGGYGWAGVFDLQARKLLWTDEVVPAEEREKTGNQLVVSRPISYAGERVYVIDAEDTLHIYERK